MRVLGRDGNSGGLDKDDEGDDVVEDVAALPLDGRGVDIVDDCAGVEVARDVPVQYLISFGQSR